MTTTPQLHMPWMFITGKIEFPTEIMGYNFKKTKSGK